MSEKCQARSRNGDMPPSGLRHTPGASHRSGHRFKDSSKESYRADAGELRWPGTLSFLRLHLGSAWEGAVAAGDA